MFFSSLIDANTTTIRTLYNSPCRTVRTRAIGIIAGFVPFDVAHCSQVAIYNIETIDVGR